MKLIIGLGNPGKEYSCTRHNIGFMAIDKIVDSLSLNFDRSKFGGIYTSTNINGEKIIFLKPQEYINLSGNVIKKYMDFFDIDIQDILVIHDDLDLDVGVMKLRTKGGSGGHNGLKNIEANLKSKNYRRIKVGISNNKMFDTKDYVLGRLVGDDKNKIDSILDIIPNVFNDFLNMTFENLMNKYN